MPSETTKLIPHIDHVLVPKPHPPMYLMHKFWARKPHNVVAEYIQHYSKKGDIVLDPFCGSGVTAIESLGLDRKAIAIDLNPIAILITKITALPINLDKFKQTYRAIEKNVRNEIDQLYETQCPKCKGIATIICTRWQNGEPTEIRNLICPKCEMVRDKKLDSKDLEKIKNIEKSEVPYWYPKTKFYYEDGSPFIKKEKTGTIPDLFTKRNLIALSILFNEIGSLKDGQIKDLLKFTFSSTLVQTSRMMLWSKTSRPSWKVHSYWVPPENVEMNVWDRFENSFEKIHKGKKEAQERVGESHKEAKSFSELQDDKDILIMNQSTLDLQIIPSNSIDYVFTDPPYGGAIQYFELSYLWASWLSDKNDNDSFDLNFSEEITINKAQKKNFDYYHKMLKASFKEIYRVLKSGAWLTVTFHNTSIKIYNSILKAVILAGFDLENIIYQPPAKKGSKQQLQPYGSAIGDYYIRFRKPEKRSSLPDETQIDEERYERIVIEAVKKIIAKRGDPTPYSIIIKSYSDIFKELKKNGYGLSVPERIDTVLKRHLNKEFVLVEGKWWFKDPNIVPFIEQVPLNERIEISVMDVFNKKIKIQFNDILQYIFLSFKNALTPETQDIIDVVEEFGEKTKDGKWILKPIIKQRESEHDEIAEMVANIGKKIGLNVHADLSKWRKNEFPQVTSDLVNNIKEIDVVWYDNNEITHEFEVENTTGI